MRWIRTASITSLLHKATGREVLPAGELGNALQLFEDKPIDPDAWDIDFFYEDKWQDITDLSEIKVVEQGPVRAALEMTRQFGKSVHEAANGDLRRQCPSIDFETWVDWHEDQKCLKAAFPVDVNTDKARYEIQFGNIERPTHTNTSWDFARFEVCGHKWADLSEEGFGLSVMNDCKYGHHTKGNVMRLTLLALAQEPGPDGRYGRARLHLLAYAARRNLC